MFLVYSQTLSKEKMAIRILDINEAHILLWIHQNRGRKIIHNMGLSEGSKVKCTLTQDAVYRKQNRDLLLRE